MIKLERGECPKELTQEVVEELTKIYIKDKEEDVWNNAKIKVPLKKALMDMSNSKCAYCECELNIESKDVTIDHFKPKVTNKDIVVKWDNLLPSCLRCNRTKNRKEEDIINPCTMEPKEHIGVRQENRYRMKSKDILGEQTIDVLALNDINRMLVPRMKVCEKIIEELKDLRKNIEDMGIKPRFIRKLEGNLIECQKDKEYSAIKATNILNHEHYIWIREKLKKENKWTIQLRKLEEELSNLKLDII